MKNITHGSLFSGIGGFDLAAEWMGWENVFHCEWNEFGQRILKHYWPKAISYHDITKTDFTIHRGKIDILTGGFPCQPYSQAGKRLGKADERHLWPQMLRAVREIQPGYVVGENVRGLTNWNGGMVFDEVQADLETEGYEVLPFLLPACGVGAPHRRDRIWFVAHNEGFNRHLSKATGIRKEGIDINGNGGKGTIADTKSKQSERMRFELGEFSESKQGEFGRNHSEFVGKRDATDTISLGQSRKEYGEAFAGLCGKNSERPNWHNFPTQSPVCSGDDGLPKQLDGITFSKWRNESIKAYGNAIVPQVAYEIFKCINQLL